MYTAVVIFLFAASSFTAFTWVSFVGGSMPVAQLSTLAVPALFLGVIALSFRRFHPAVLAAGKVTSAAMGFLNFAFIAALLCWPAFWGAALLDLGVGRPAIAFALFGLAALAAVYGLINASRLRVTRYTVRLKHLPPRWHGCEVAVVSDIHLGTIWGAGLVRAVVARLNALEPQMVFLPGDMFDGAEVDIDAALAPWTELRAPAGAYFATGNHDEFRDPAAYVAGLSRVGIRVLENEKVIVDGLQIVGLRDSTAHRPADYRRALASVGLDPSQPSVLLAHRPAHLEIPEAAGISLVLSGHTHAGQFPLWTWLVRAVYRQFAYGLNRRGELQVITSSGAGSGGPPLRVCTRSEIVMVRLEAGEPH